MLMGGLVEDYLQCVLLSHLSKRFKEGLLVGGLLECAPHPEVQSSYMLGCATYTLSHVLHP